MHTYRLRHSLKRQQTKKCMPSPSTYEKNLNCRQKLTPLGKCHCLSSKHLYLLGSNDTFGCTRKMSLSYMFAQLSEANCRFLLIFFYKFKTAAKYRKSTYEDGALPPNEPNPIRKFKVTLVISCAMESTKLKTFSLSISIDFDISIKMYTSSG